MLVHGPQVPATAHAVPSEIRGQHGGSRPPKLGTSFAGRSEPVDTINLSEVAQEIAGGGTANSVRGNSANSPAHRARAMIQEHPDLANMPFGKVVSGLIHGTIGTDLEPTNDTLEEPIAGADDVDGETPLTDTEAPSASEDENSSSDFGTVSGGNDALAVEPSGSDPNESIVDSFGLVPTVSGALESSLVDEVLDGADDAAGTGSIV